MWVRKMFIILPDQIRSVCQLKASRTDQNVAFLTRSEDVEGAVPVEAKRRFKTHLKLQTLRTVFSFSYNLDQPAARGPNQDHG